MSARRDAKHLGARSLVFLAHLPRDRREHVKPTRTALRPRRQSLKNPFASSSAYSNVQTGSSGPHGQTGPAAPAQTRLVSALIETSEQHARFGFMVRDMTSELRLMRMR